MCETNNPRARKWKLTRNLESSWARRERRVEISQTYNPPIPIPIPITSSRQRNAFERSCSESFLVFICRLLLKSQNMKEKKAAVAAAAMCVRTNLWSNVSQPCWGNFKKTPPGNDVSTVGWPRTGRGITWAFLLGSIALADTCQFTLKTPLTACIIKLISYWYRLWLGQSASVIKLKIAKRKTKNQSSAPPLITNFEYTQIDDNQCCLHWLFFVRCVVSFLCF